jgi:hypothetical protein
MLRIKLIATESLPQGVNVYRDFSFLFEPASELPVNPPANPLDPYLGIRMNQSFVLYVVGGYSTLSFVVAAVNGRLHSLDIYAPPQSWLVDNSLNLPSVQKHGELQFLCEWNEGEPAFARRSGIEYRVNLEQGLVRLRFAEAHSPEYAQIANCLVACIDKEDNSLTEIWLQDVAGLADAKRTLAICVVTP